MLCTFKIPQRLKITKSWPIRPLPAHHGNKQINPHMHTLINDGSHTDTILSVQVLWSMCATEIMLQGGRLQCGFFPGGGEEWACL